VFIGKLSAKVDNVFDIEFSFDKGLNVIFGANESGKTTLLNLFRYLFYPFEKNAKPWFIEFITAKADFEINSSKCEIYIEKSNVKVLPDDLILKNIQSKVDYLTFKNSFSVNIEELISFDYLTHLDSKKDFLLQATGLKDFLKVSTIKKDLEKIIGSLFKERGKNPKINSLLLECAKLEKEIQELKSRIADFDEEYALLNTLEREINTYKNEIYKLKKDLESKKELLAPFDYYLDTKYLEERIVSLKKSVLVSEKDYLKVEKLYQELEDIDRDLNNIEIEISTLNELIEKNSLMVDEKKLLEMVNLQAEIGDFNEAELKDKFDELKHKKDFEDLPSKDELLKLIKQRDNGFAKLNEIEKNINLNLKNVKMNRLIIVVLVLLAVLSVFFTKDNNWLKIGFVFIFTSIISFLFYKNRLVNKETKDLLNECNQVKNTIKNAEDEISKYGFDEKKEILELLNDLENRKKILDEIEKVNVKLDKFKKFKQLSLELNIDLEKSDFNSVIKTLLAQSNYKQKLETDRKILMEKRSRLQIRKDWLKEELNDIFKILNVKSVDEIKEGFEHKKELLKMEEEFKARQHKFESLFGITFIEYMKKIEGVDKYYLESEIKGIDQKIITNQEKVEELLKSKSEIEGKLNVFIDKTDLSEKEERLERLKNMLSENINLYLEYLGAYSILDNTLKRFEKEYQPEILKSASNYFSSFTKNRYEKIITDYSGHYFIEDLNYQIKDISQLSTGTRDQLFLALRLAFIDFIDDEFKLPLFFDEVTANFDEERENLFIETLKEISKYRQIFLFTCKESLMNKFYGEVLRIT